MQIKAGVAIYKGPSKKLVYERKIWPIKYMYPSKLAQEFVDELDKIVQKIKSKKS